VALGPAFYARDTIRVARALLGCVLESRAGGRMTSGRIVEVEAYVGPHDPAAHGYGGTRRTRNASMFGPPGTAYVYRSYGLHWCFNVVTEKEGYPAAVLVRALEPLRGRRVMAVRRGTLDPHGWCAGPGRLAQALDITGACDGTSLQGSPLRIIPPREATRRVVYSSPRIGVSKAADWPLRFVIAGSEWTSRPGRDRTASRTRRT